MGMAVGGGGGINSDINVTPLVDVVLVLLIIFMVVTPMLTRGYDLDIPQKMENIEIPQEIVADQLIVTYTARDGIWINKDLVERADFATTIEQILAGRRKKSVFFAPAREVNYDEVVQILDIIRGAGAEAIGLVTDDALTVRPDQQGAAAAAAAAEEAAAAPPSSQ